MSAISAMSKEFFEALGFYSAVLLQIAINAYKASEKPPQQCGFPRKLKKGKAVSQAVDKKGN